MNSLQYASWVEILQLTLAFVAVSFGFWRLWIAIQNGLLITHTESTDLRRVVAETQVLGELFRLFKLGCLVAMGWISVLLPPPPHNTDLALTPDDELQGVLLRLGLITLTVAMVADSLVQEYRRRQFLARVVVSDEVSTPVSTAQVAGLHESIQAGTDAAHAAYEEANKVNVKISDLNARLLSEEKRRP